jgi:hypothetical protein
MGAVPEATGQESSSKVGVMKRDAKACNSMKTW